MTAAAEAQPRTGTHGHQQPDAPETPARRRRKRGHWAAYVFLLPWILGMVVITLGPMIASLYLSLTDYNLIGRQNFVGLENYREMFTDDPRFMASIWVTVQFVFISVPLQLAFALGLAVLLNQGLRGLAFYRSAYYLPSLLGSSVAIAVLWRQIFGAEGLFNQALGLLGFQNLPNWISTPEWALGTVMVLNVWTFGAPMLIFLAGLRQVPVELHEAAQMDGAGVVGRFFRITIPILSPVLFFNLVLQMISAFQTFTQVYIVSGGTGGPVDSTLFYTLYLYQQAFTEFDMGYASALAWILLAITGLFTWLAFGTSKYWVHYTGD